MVRCGDNTFGELGDGSTKGSDLPVKVRLPKADKAIATASGSQADFFLAIVHHT